MQPTTEALFWAGYPGCFGLPACSVPLELCEEKAGDGSGQAVRLPVGAQIVGPAFGDIDVLAFAQFLEREYRAFEAPAMAA
jgi:amidase